MDTATIIGIVLLAIIALQLFEISRHLRLNGDLLQRISLGLFPIPSGGLDQLTYLQHIDAKLQKIEKIIEQKKP